MRIAADPVLAPAQLTAVALEARSGAQPAVQLPAASFRPPAGQPAAAAGRVLRYSLEIGLQRNTGALAAVSETLRAADGDGDFVAVREAAYRRELASWRTHRTIPAALARPWRRG